MNQESLDNELPTGTIETVEFGETTQITLGYNYTENVTVASPNCMTSKYINVTCELPIDYAVPLYGYIMPFLLIITIIANTLIVVVLSKRHMRTPTNIVLMAMALCDMFTLLFPAPWLIYMYTFGNHYKPLWPISTCYAWAVMHEVSIQFQLIKCLHINSLYKFEKLYKIINLYVINCLFLILL